MVSGTSRYAPQRGQPTKKPIDDLSRATSRLTLGNWHQDSTSSSKYHGFKAPSRAATNDNWWKKDDRPSRAGFYNAGPKSQGLDANYALRMTQQICTVGKIVRAAVHEPSFDENQPPVNDINSTWTSFGNVYSKVRWMIVVATYENSYLAIPLYTHRGTGLDNKSRAAKLEYVSVCDTRHTEFENLTENQLLDAKMNRGTTKLNVKTVAYLVAPVTRKYELLVEEQGCLTKQSTDYLVQLARETMFRGSKSSRNLCVP